MSTVEDLCAALEDEIGRAGRVDSDVLRRALDSAGAEVVAPGDLLGPAQAAEFLGVNRTTISRWKREGYMPEPFVDLGSQGIWTLWTRTALEAFREQRTAEGIDAAGRRPPAAA